MRFPVQPDPRCDGLEQCLVLVWQWRAAIAPQMLEKNLK
jgi:hypothetical protein